MTAPSLCRAILAAVLVAVAALLPQAAAAQTQATGLAGQTLGRGYWHVFLAYALAWALVLGWVVTIARRLARVEHRLDETR